MIQEALGHLGVVSGAPFLPIFTIQMALPSWDKPNLVKISKIFWLFDLYDEFYDEDNLVFVAKDFYLFQLNYFWMPLTEIPQVILFVFPSDGHVRLFFIFDWDPSGIPVCISEICSLLLFHQLSSLTVSLCQPWDWPAQMNTINCAILGSGIRGSGDPRRKWEEMGERERERESVLKCVAFVCKMI